MLQHQIILNLFGMGLACIYGKAQVEYSEVLLCYAGNMNSTTGPVVKNRAKLI